MVGLRQYHRTVEQRYRPGFSIIELMISIAIIGVLLLLVFAYFPSTQQRARDQERIADAQTIARYLEQRYREKASTAFPSYPTTTSFASDVPQLISGGFKDASRAPGQSSNSIVMATSNADLTAAATTQTYIYQPLLTSGALCTAATESNPCARFRIWYKLENGSPTVRLVESRYQQ